MRLRGSSDECAEASEMWQRANVCESEVTDARRIFKLERDG